MAIPKPTKEVIKKRALTVFNLLSKYGKIGKKSKNETGIKRNVLHKWLKDAGYDVKKVKEFFNNAELFSLFLTLYEHNGNFSKAEETLGLGDGTLASKFKSAGFDPKEINQLFIKYGFKTKYNYNHLKQQNSKITNLIKINLADKFKVNTKRFVNIDINKPAKIIKIGRVLEILREKESFESQEIANLRASVFLAFLSLLPNVTARVDTITASARYVNKISLFNKLKYEFPDKSDKEYRTVIDNLISMGIIIDYNKEQFVLVNPEYILNFALRRETAQHKHISVADADINDITFFMPKLRKK